MVECIRNQLAAIWMLWAMTVILHPAQADELPPGEKLLLVCWVGDDQEISIACVNPATGGQLETEDAALVLDYASSGGRARLARLVRSNPLAFANTLWFVPLYVVPFDMEDVRLLARSVLCRGYAVCEIEMVGTV